MREDGVRPDAQAFLEMLAANPRPDFTAELLAQIRTLPADAMARLDAPTGELAVVRDLTMPGPAGGLALRLFDPRETRAAGPVVVFYHGGGFVIGNIDTHAALAAEISRQLDLPVASVEYRLAPEHPWPAAPDDAEAAARWIAANGPALGLEITGLVLCGDSAGGNLAIVTAMALRDTPAAAPVLLQVALYPGVDHSRSTESKAAYCDGYGLESRNMRLYMEHYRPDPQHPRASPLLADQQGMPPSVIATAAFDPLRDEGRAYAAKLISAGIDTLFHEARGMIHGFASYRGVIPSAQADLTAILTLAKAAL